MTSLDPGTAVFIDSNILVYANVASAPEHAAARDRLDVLQDNRQTLCISPQVIREYLVAVTRPQTFSRPQPPAVAAARAEQFARDFRLLDRTPATLPHLFDLLRRFDVKGKEIHDANIVATMLPHGVRRLQTHNTGDFARYANLIQIEPLVP